MQFHPAHRGVCNNVQRSHAATFAYQRFNLSLSGPARLLCRTYLIGKVLKKALSGGGPDDVREEDDSDSDKED